jgi:hypothetical protein
MVGRKISDHIPRSCLPRRNTAVNRIGFDDPDPIPFPHQRRSAFISGPCPCSCEISGVDSAADLRDEIPKVIHCTNAASERVASDSVGDGAMERAAGASAAAMPKWSLSRLGSALLLITLTVEAVMPEPTAM